jgi:hypothetical protein
MSSFAGLKRALPDCVIICDGGYIAATGQGFSAEFADDHKVTRKPSPQE